MIQKICFFSTCFAVHKKVRMEYAEKYLPQNIKIFLLTPRKHNKYNLRRAEIIEMPDDKVNFVLKLRRFCKENKIDLLVNLGTSNESFGMLFSTFGLKTEYIVNEIGDIWEGLRIEKKISKKVFIFIKNILLAIPFAFAKKIIYPSVDICEENKKYFFFIKNKLVQTPLIIDEKLFSPKNKVDIRRKLNLPAKKEIILYVGRIFYLKGSDILLELIKNNPDRLFILIGEMIDQDYKSQRLANLLWVPEITVEGLVDYYNSADLFIFPTRVDAYGLVHREAMLCETPALVSNVPAVRLTKFALKAELDIKDMQRKIDAFFSMPRREREKLGQISRKCTIETNSYKVLKDQHKNLLLN